MYKKDSSVYRQIIKALIQFRETLPASSPHLPLTSHLIKNMERPSAGRHPKNFFTDNNGNGLVIELARKPDQKRSGKRHIYTITRVTTHGNFITES